MSLDIRGTAPGPRTGGHSSTSVNMTRSAVDILNGFRDGCDLGQPQENDCKHAVELLEKLISDSANLVEDDSSDFCTSCRARVNLIKHKVIEEAKSSQVKPSQAKKPSTTKKASPPNLLAKTLCLPCYAQGKLSKFVKQDQLFCKLTVEELGTLIQHIRSLPVSEPHSEKKAVDQLQDFWELNACNILSPHKFTDGMDAGFDPKHLVEDLAGLPHTDKFQVATEKVCAEDKVFTQYTVGDMLRRGFGKTHTLKLSSQEIKATNLQLKIRFSLSDEDAGTERIITVSVITKT